MVDNFVNHNSHYTAVGLGVRTRWYTNLTHPKEEGEHESEDGDSLVVIGTSNGSGNVTRR